MMPEHDLPRPSSMKELGASGVSSKESLGLGLVRKVSWQGNPHPQAEAVAMASPVHHAKSCSSFSTLHSTEDPDATYYKPKRRISFDERVSVREFDSTSCVSLKDMEPPSPVRPVPKVILCATRNNENLPMIDAYPESPVVPRTTSTMKPCLTLTLEQLLRREIRTILMVDPHDIFLQLFSKRLQDMLPHVQIIKAHSSEEALQVLSTTHATFDVIIAEERLSLFHKHKNRNLGSGSSLLAHLKQHYPRQFLQALVVMVSAHWQSDHPAMAQSGADYCWSKVPPPVLTTALLEEMLHTLLHKRGQHELAKEFMLRSSFSATDNNNV